MTIFILLLITLGVILYVLWFFVLNKGIVVFEGRPPYTISLNNEQFSCMESTCSYELTENTYNYSISNEGYYTKSGSLDLKRFETVMVDAHLEFVPEILPEIDWTTFIFPPGYSKHLDRLKDISLFQDLVEPRELKRLPKKINDILFSKSGNLAIVFEDESVSLYDTQEFTMEELSEISDATSATWSNDETKIYTISFDEEAKKDALKRIQLDGSTESLIFFTRNLEEYKISVSSDERKVAIADRTFQPEILYIIDLEESSRKNVFEGTAIELGEWTEDGEVFVYSAKENATSSQKLWEWNKGTVNRLPFISSIQSLVAGNDEELFFITDTSYNIVGATEPFEVTFNPDVSDPEMLITELQEEKDLLLFMGDLSTNTFFLLKDLTNSLQITPEKMERDDTIRLRMLIEDKLIEVKISE